MIKPKPLLILSQNYKNNRGRQ